MSRVLLRFNSSKPQRVDGTVLPRNLTPVHCDKLSQVVPLLPCILGSFSRREPLLHVCHVHLLPPPGTSNGILLNPTLVYFTVLKCWVPGAHHVVTEDAGSDDLGGGGFALLHVRQQTMPMVGQYPKRILHHSPGVQEAVVEEALGA